MCNNSYHLNNKPQVLVLKQWINKGFAVVVLLAF